MCEFLPIGAKSTSIMVVYNQLEAIVATDIYFGDVTAILTIIHHQKENYFLLWRYCSGVTFSHLYKLGRFYCK
ncbi:MAG: hypothetical protein RM347_006735 [Nostoc sp. ChiQUE02]|uniref:hypothetical protein n=1 Tax=Nostoc sp. ChiQUE02 TaxID=3075377 RepID=UPI003D1620C7